MGSYLLVESRSDQESPDVTALFDLGTRLRAEGNEVAVFLVQNAVLAMHDETVHDLVANGVRVWADRYSILARGLDPEAHPAGVSLGGADDLVDLLMADGTTPVWH